MEEKQEESRFMYSDNSGLNLLSEKDILEGIEEDKSKIKELEDKLVKSMKSGFNYEEMEKVSAEIEKIKESSSKQIEKSNNYEKWL